MSTGKVKVAVAGCGAIAHVMHLPGLKAMEELGKVEIVGICDVIEDSAKRAAQAFGISPYFTDLDEMIARADFDLLVNLTRIPEHFTISLVGLRAGKHVYTQKPMAVTVEEATTLIDEARKFGLKLGCAPEHPVRPMMRKMKALIGEGAIGKVTFARVQSSHGGPEKHDVPRDSTWYYKPGSSPILDLGVHGLSMITGILGPVKRLACFSGRSLPVRHFTAGPYIGKRIDVEIDDNSLLMLDFGDARFAFLDASYCVDASKGPRLEIHGSEGTLSVVGPPRDATLHLYQSKTKEWTEVEVPEPPPVRDLGVLHMVDCLLDEKPLELTGERGRHLLEIMAKAPRAAREGRTLELETTL